MNVFARLCYDVWTMDHEGYGKKLTAPTATPTSPAASRTLIACDVCYDRPRNRPNSQPFLLGEIIRCPARRRLRHGRSPTTSIASCSAP